MKRLFAFVSVVATLMLVMAACRPMDVPKTPTVTVATETANASPLPPTETATAEPTVTIAPTETLMPTITPTPEVWEIWFNGFSCAQAQDCNPDPSTEYYFYSIMSDGTGLRQLEVTEFPPILALPENAPPLKQQGAVPPPLLSPDKTSVLYLGDKGILYKVNVSDGQTTILYTPTQERVGPYCWSSDGQSIAFLTLAQSSVAMFSVNQDGENLRQEFDLKETSNIVFGVCSPDHQEMATSVPWGDKLKSGLLIINVNSGEIRRILNNFSVWTVRVAPEHQ